MLYKFLRVLMTFGLKFYFRKIDVSGVTNIPKDQPIIFACNHPSSFMEACLLACVQPRVLHFLVRGDVFEMGWLRPILHLTNQIPIYRFKDGFSNLKKNKSTFSKAYEILEKGGAIIIYPEGSTIWTKSLRPLQRGMARISMGAMEERGIEEINIVPVGFNYSDVVAWRSDVSIQIGNSLLGKEYHKDYVADTIGVLKKLTKDTYEALFPLVIHFDEYQNAHDYLLINALHGDLEESKYFSAQKETSDRFREVVFKEDFSLDLDQYIHWTSPRETWYHGLRLIMMIIPGIIGALLVLPCLYIGSFVVKRSKMSIEFIAPARLAILIILMSIGTLLALVLLLLLQPDLLIFLLLIPFVVQAFALLRTDILFFKGWIKTGLTRDRIESLYKTLRNS